MRFRRHVIYSAVEGAAISSSLNADSALYPGLRISHTHTVPFDTIHFLWNNTPSGSIRDLVLKLVSEDCPVRKIVYELYHFDFRQQPHITASQPFYCGIPVVLSGNGTAAQWSPANGLSATNTNVVTASPSVNTRYYFSSACGTDSVLITARPVIHIGNLNDSTLCPLSFTQLLPQIAPVANYTFDWQPANEFFNGINGQGIITSPTHIFSTPTTLL